MGHFRQLHETRDAFRQALSFTEADSGFAQRLIEKDYYCSLLLADFEPLFASGLVFKGGTCLSKVHAGFYRLSEDLDFAISIPMTANRQKRREAVAPVKRHLEQIAERLPALSVSDQLTGKFESRQYQALLQYESAVTGERETVKVDVSVRESVIESPVFRDGRTLLRHPLPRETPDAPLSLCVLTLREAYAEKVRAALTRDPPAIRDTFDIVHAIRTGRLDFLEPSFLDLVRQKLAVAGNPLIGTSEARRRSLEDQLETHLKPVLRSSDYAEFDIEHAFAEVEKLAALV
jgi:predicted nucleotidyltransferase component of viral defense system